LDAKFAVVKQIEAGRGHHASEGIFDHITELLASKLKSRHKGACFVERNPCLRIGRKWLLARQRRANGIVRNDISQRKLGPNMTGDTQAVCSGD
jgi:hypothetical protein